MDWVIPYLGELHAAFFAGDGARLRSLVADDRSVVLPARVRAEALALAEMPRGTRRTPTALLGFQAEVLARMLEDLDALDGRPIGPQPAASWDPAQLELPIPAGCDACHPRGRPRG